MEFAASGRIVVVAQWALAVLLPLFVFLGRGLVGAQLGWMAVIGVLYGWVLIVLLLIAPVITLFDTEARTLGTVREWYAIATALLWLGLLVVGISLPDSGDSGHLASALSSWTGASYEVSLAVFNAGAGLAAARLGGDAGHRRPRRAARAPRGLNVRMPRAGRGSARTGRTRPEAPTAASPRRRSTASAPCRWRCRASRPASAAIGITPQTQNRIDAFIRPSSRGGVMRWRNVTWVML